MARGAGGTALDEPPQDPHQTQPERRSRSSRRANAKEPDGDAGIYGVRQARRLRARQRRFWFVLMPTVAVLLILTVAIGALIRDNTDEGDSATSAAGAAGAPASQTILLAHRSRTGSIDLLTLVGTSAKTASVLLIPVATQVEVPSLGPQALADLPDEGDRALLQTTIENLLGVKVTKTVVLDDAALSALLVAAAPVPVDLHRAVQFGAGAGARVAAGRHPSSAAETSRLLVAHQSGSELDRLVTVQDVLDGWFGRLRSPAVAKATLHVQPDLGPLIAAAHVSDRRTDTLPVESVTTDGGERFEPRAAEIARYAETAFPKASLAVGGKRPRVEILNGTGAVGLAQTIAAQVVPAGGQVTLTGNVEKFGLDKTQVVYYRDADRRSAQRLLRALGCGWLQKADTALGVVDVTILAGADCFRTGAASAH